MNSPKKVLLVGLGGIGFQYDLDNLDLPKSSQYHEPQTHYGAAVQNAHNVIGGVDLDRLARDNFEKVTSLKSWRSINDFNGSEEVDILVVATPTSTHLEQFIDACTILKPRAVLFEKPFGMSAKESKEMIGLSKEFQIPIIVNYSRNFSKGFDLIRKKVADEGFESGHVLYGQGLRENGSHFLRLIIELFGAPLKIALNSEKYISQNPSFTMFFANSKLIVFSGSDIENTRLGEIYLETSTSAIRISEGMQYEIYSITKGSKPLPWLRDLLMTNQGDLSGGMSQLYCDTSWTNPKSFSACIQRNHLDMECNRIIDDFLLA